MFFSFGFLPIVYGLLLFTFVKTVYNLYFHPLRSYPGPWLARASRWYYSYYLKIGRLPHKTKEWHDKYGRCVRIAPDELSYNTAEAWEDICGHRTESRMDSFEKDLTFFPPSPNGVDSIVIHRRFRRLLSHPMSDKALSAQQEIITGYVDQLIDELRERSVGHKGDKKGVVDMVRWFNFTSFDILGDLAFGEPFGCLRSGVMHPWIELIFTAIKSVMDMQIIRRVPGAFPLMMAIAGMFQQSQHLQDQFMFCQKKARERLSRETTRPDFMTYILRATEEKGMTQDEIEANAQILIMAGSETTASALSGTLFYLLKSPEVMQKLRKEMECNFQQESDITMRSTQGLEYLNAVIQEAMRVYPPVPCTFPRTTPPAGAMVCGQFVPGGYIVGINQMAAMTSAKNFTDPTKFVPERWLGDERYISDCKKAYQPFSYGPRNCLGKNLAYAEMRLVLTRLLWNFDLELLEESKDWHDRQKVWMMWDKGDLNVKIRPLRP
ncbi:isotrichodermin C-15 hydroxylase [Nannizzia gypsea CBS 118893]|uniref:Isotrichodermin C-15 hydroxylase n=1 Tax=Arthroderma gypseum (strain ATCC MYA-4604 / CBS 118893) TaxID=535722 RepID=E4UMT2_ARTGP|nr:isotrichodermin C-15 hydroxylase [Nannizzia gypsea CBS 118893]EFR00286.1 isotrichodermin C-15 hydroxylase [Nannizzia gypsea CBS 118893]